jgi:hypothetical protein
MTAPPSHPMHRVTRAAALLALITPVGLLAACDDSDSDAGPDTTLSREDWFETVNDLCTDHNEALGTIIGPLFAEGPPADDAAQAALDEIVRRTRSITAKIDALPEPSALTIHVAALVSSLNAGSDQAETMGGPAFFAAHEVDPFRPAADIAGELGLEACDTED